MSVVATMIIKSKWRCLELQYGSALSYMDGDSIGSFLTIMVAKRRSRYIADRYGGGYGRKTGNGVHGLLDGEMAISISSIGCLGKSCIRRRWLRTGSVLSRCPKVCTKLHTR